MEHVITESPYLCSPNILWHPDCQTKAVALDFAGTGGCIKAGSPINAAGKVANDASAVGVLLHDAHELCCSHGLVVIGGYIKSDIAQSHSGIEISDAARSAMSRLAFIGADGAPDKQTIPYDCMPDGYPKKSVQNTVLMEEQEVAFTNGVSPMAGGFDLVVGSIYTVKWDGVEYECECKSVQDGPYIGNPYIGNPMVFEAVDTGEPFMYTFDGEIYAFLEYNNESIHTIGVSEQVAAYEPMSTKFLPFQNEVLEPNFWESRSQSELEDIVNRFAAGDIFRFGVSLLLEASYSEVGFRFTYFFDTYIYFVHGVPGNWTKSRKKINPDLT